MSTGFFGGGLQELARLGGARPPWAHRESTSRARGSSTRGLNPPAPRRTHRAQGRSVSWLLCFLRIVQGCLEDRGKRD